jgi:hypothetical protein
MRLNYGFCVALVMGLTVTSGVAPAQVSGRVSASSNEASCRAFVQKFYDWYIKATRNKGFDTALKARRSSFSPTLLAALKEDLAASAKNSEEVVGLDFDPIVASQDMPERYVAGMVTRTRNVYRVKVFSKGVGGSDKVPAVIPVLENRRGKWVFTNFIYPGDGKGMADDLLHLLKTLRDEREHAKTRPAK